MDKKVEMQGDKDGTLFEREIAAKVARKLKAQRKATHVWFGLGMMGLVGWSIVVPTVLGITLGSWIDSHHPGSHSWTLMLLVIGLLFGCLNAWYWVKKEEKAMREDEENHDN